jgi:hypothetical protein
MMHRTLSSRLSRFLTLLPLMLAMGPGMAFAQAKARILQQVDPASRVTLKGHLSPQLQSATDLGAIPESQLAGRMMLVLQRSPEQEAALQSFLEQAHQPGSPRYHQWLTPAAFGAKYGTADSDVQQIANWLQSQGLTVAKVSSGRSTIEFTGSVGQVNAALHTSLHSYSLNGETAYSVNSEPQIPAAFSGIVTGITNLSSFGKAKPALTSMGQAIYNPNTHTGQPQWTIPGGFSSTLPIYFLTPEDFATQYDVKPVYAAGINGAGQSIAIIDESNIDISLVNNYRKLFGLSYNPPQIIIDGNDPGIGSSAIETYLDVENAGAIAPAATIKLYIAGTVGLSGGGLLPYAAVRAVEDDAASTISVSWSGAEYAGTSNNNFWSTLWEQAVAQGQTVFVSTGDSGVASAYGLSVNGIASNPYAVAVGGTDAYFPDYATGGAGIANFWSNTNDSTYGSLQKPMLEQPWNGSIFGLNSISYDPISYQTTHQVGGGGGASYCAVGTGTLSSITHEPICTSGWPKPTWQAGTGVPADGVRDLPDVSLFASNAINGIIWPICANPGDCLANSTTGNNLFVSSVGGTSAAAPAMAAVMALIDQKYGPQGQANNVLYPLAKQFPTSFNPVDIGSNNQPCNKGTYECSLDTNDSYYSYQNYYAHSGYDLASGLGSVDVNQMINNWSKIAFKATTTALTLSPVSLTHGQTAKVAVTVAGTGTPTGDVALVSSTTLPNNSSLGFLTLSGGSASGSLNNLPGGTYNVLARYAGDGVNAASTSAPVSVTVAAEPSTATMTAYSHSLVSYPTIVSVANGGTVGAGYNTVFDVQIANAAGTIDGVATGVVTFTVNGAVAGSSSVDANGTAEWIGGYLPVGSYTISATYSGDASFQASSTTPFNFSVIQNVKSNVGVFNDPSCTSSKTGFTCIAGTNVTFTGIITTYANFTEPVPTGTITYTLGSNSPIVVPLGPLVTEYFEGSNLIVLGAVAPVSFTNLQSTASLTGGYETLTAVYSGDANYKTASTSTRVTVNPPATGLLPSTTTIAIANPTSGTITPGTLVSITGTVKGNGTIAPTGTITAHVGYSLYLTPAKLVPGANGVSTATVSFTPGQLGTGDNFMTFAYSGDANYLPGSSTAVDVQNTYTDFSLQTPTTAIAITDGATGSATINITPLFSFTGPVALTCSAPGSLICTLGSASVTVGSTGIASTTVTLNTVTPIVTGSLPSDLGWPSRTATGTALAALLLFVLPRRKRLGKVLFALVAVAALSAGIGCGHSSSQPASTAPTTQLAVKGNYTVTVTGTSVNGAVHSVPLTVTVQ